MPGDIALIVVDMQNEFCDPQGFMLRIAAESLAVDEKELSHFPAVTANTRKLLKAARAGGCVVVYTKYSLNRDYSDAGRLTTIFPQIERASALVRGTWENEICPDLRPEPGEVVVEKHRYSAFFGTNLDEVLRERRVKRVAVCGVTTNICVDGTVRDAFYLDYDVLIASDATAALTADLHDAALANFSYGFGQVVTSAELAPVLAAGEPSR